MRASTRARPLLRCVAAIAVALPVTAASVMVPALADFPDRTDPSTAASTQNEPSSQESNGAKESLAPTMLVLDASGSMQEDDPSGGTRMDVAKEALHTVVDKAPSGAELGLMAYGTTPGKVANDPKLGCQDINTLREVGPVDGNGKQALTSKIDKVTGHGYTPIGASLAAAAKELPGEGPRSIILVSDGEETCDPPPTCEVAKKLKEQGVDLTMHTVGFRVGDEARDQLQCVAEAGGGTYVDAPDAKTLQKELPKISDRALRSYELDGDEVTGTPQVQSNSPKLGPGQYVDTLDHDQVRTYRLEVPEGFDIHTSAAAVVARDDEIKGYGLELGIRIMDKRGVTCSQTKDRWALQWVPVASVAEQWKPGDNRKCLSDGPFYLQVGREGPYRDNNQPYDLELQVIAEPPVNGNTGPEPTPKAPSFSEPGGELESVTGGAGFNQATKLPTKSGRYGDEIGFGEITTYKVWLDWGQSLAVRAHGRKGEELQGRSFSRVGVQLHGPTRQGNAEQWQEVDSWFPENGKSLPPIAMPPVAYEHRNAMKPDDPQDDDRYQATYLSGWHYITVWMRPEKTKTQAPVELEVSIGGEKADPPGYEQVGSYPAKPITSKSDLKQGSSSGSGEAGESGQSKGSESGNSEGSDEMSDETTATASEGWSSLPWILGGVGGLVLLGLTAGLILVRRRPS